MICCKRVTLRTLGKFINGKETTEEVLTKFVLDNDDAEQILEDFLKILISNTKNSTLMNPFDPSNSFQYLKLRKLKFDYYNCFLMRLLQGTNLLKCLFLNKDFLSKVLVLNVLYHFLKNLSKKN